MMQAAEMQEMEEQRGQLVCEVNYAVHAAFNAQIVLVSNARPPSDIDTSSRGQSKALDPNRPIREADIRLSLST
jgi:hypothetical protein